MTDWQIVKLIKKGGRLSWVLEVNRGSGWSEVTHRADYQELAKVASGFFRVDVNEYPIVERRQEPSGKHRKPLSWVR